MRPSDIEEEKRPNRTIDWITFKFFQTDSRVMSAYVKTVRGSGSKRTSCYTQHEPCNFLTSTTTDIVSSNIRVDNLHPPSDHMPVIAIFEIFPPKD